MHWFTKIILLSINVVCLASQFQARIDGIYLLRFKNTTQNYHTELMSDKLLYNQYKISVLKSYHIGKFETFLVKDIETSLTSFKERFGNQIEFEPDAIVEKFGRHLSESRFQDYPECISQNVGKYLWGLGRISNKGSMQGNAQIHYTYNNSESLENVHVYVMDTGIFTGHQDFEGRAKWVYTASNIIAEGNLDLNGHGTHVAGIIGGKIHGVAKTSQLYAIKVLNQYGSGTLSGILEAIEFLTNRFQEEYSRTGQKPKYIVNLSLGMRGQSEILESAIQESTTLGILYVASAGNDNEDACLWTPARIQEVITVGAVDRNDVMPGFSNYGSCVDVLAPGVDIYSAWIGAHDITLEMQGTSSAAPYVTGEKRSKLKRYHFHDCLFVLLSAFCQLDYILMGTG